MKPKERILSVLEGDLPDRIPTGELGIDYPITEKVLGHSTFYRAKFREKKAVWDGKRDQVVSSQKRDLVELAQTLGWDWLPVFLTYSSHQDYSPASFVDDRTWFDRFGRTWKYSPITEDVLCTEMPRLNEESIESLRQPFEADESELELVRHVVKTLGDSHFIVGRTSIELRDAAPVIGRGPVDGTIPEAYGGLAMDMVDFSLRLIDDPDFVKRLLTAATDRAIEVALTLIEAGVDAIILDSDYCHQTGPWASPDHFEEIVIPLLKKEVDAIHGAGAYVIKHTDGNTWPILDMVVSSGIDGLHGIQPSAGMDLATLKEKYGTQLALFGAVEGEVLINRSSEEISKLVREQIRTAGVDGRYVLTSGNSVQLGVPAENYLTMIETLREWGTYPLTE